MIKAGTICIWQNVTHPDYSYLNGTETTALSGLQMLHCCEKKCASALGYKTDTPMRGMFGLFYPKKGTPALAHELREKNPPRDEVDEVDDKVVDLVV